MANPTATNLNDVLLDASRGSYDRNAMDVQDHVLYDTSDFANTTVRPETKFFQQPVGSPYMSGTKTIVETNMDLQGQIPNSQYFVAKELSLAFLPGIAGTATTANTLIQAYTTLAQQSNYRLILAGRSFDLEMPGTSFFPPVFVAALASAANGMSVGNFMLSGWVTLKLPIVIEGGAAFSVSMKTGSANATLQTALNTASAALYTANCQMQVRVKGTLIRYK